MQTARTRRSVGQSVVDGVLRVGPAAFEARLLEDGVDSAAAPAVAPGTVVTRKNGARRKSRGKQARHARRMAKRPIMEKALADAQTAMDDAFVVTLRRRTE